MRALFACLLFSIPVFASQEVFTFIKKIKERKDKITWTLKKNEDRLFFEGIDKESSTVTLSNEQYIFSSFVYTSPTTSYSIDLSNGILSVKGITESGNRKTKTYNIGKEPWVQQFWFGFLPFLQSNEKSFRFSIINPKSFERVRMIAYKEQIEPLSIEGKNCSALRVKITLQGFKSIFWSANAWYDPESYTFLKFEANTGPNTPIMTVIHI